MGRSFNLLEPAEAEEFDKAGGHETHCPDVVGTAARIVVQMLLEMPAEMGLPSLRNI